jgi:putative ABC transport system permease protein
MQSLLQDLRYAARELLRSRGWSAVAILTLAIGIGANTAIFSIVDAVLLRPLPFRDPDRLLRLYETESAPGKYPFASLDFVDWKAQNTTFDDMALFGWPGDMNLAAEGRPEHVLAVPTAANFFSVLGAPPLLGRTWVAGEDQPGKDRVAVLGYALWQGRYAGDPHAIGQTIELNSRKYTIIGVMKADFRFPAAAQLWIPLDPKPKGLSERGSHWANAIGRMKPGISVKAAQADLSVIAAQLERQYPNSNHKVGAVVVPLHEDLSGKSRDSLLVVLGVVALVLLIACANVANLLLSRAVARQKEMAVRSALGAGRFRLARQLLTESLLLAALGGAAGLLLAWGAVTLFARAEAAAVPRFNPIGLNPVVLAFTSALAVATGLLFGLFPALQASRPGLFDELKGGAGSSISPSRRRRFTSSALVAGEMALSMLLLVSAGLLLKDFARLRGLDIGVRPEGVWTAAIQLPEAGYGGQQRRFAFAQSLVERCAAIPGVDSAAASDRLPLEGGSNYYAQVRGQISEHSSGPLVETHAATPEYFKAMGIRLVRGRLFTAADARHSIELDQRMRQAYEGGPKPPPAETDAMIYPSVINESMARAFWPGRDPVGQMFSPGNNNGPWRQVVGVVSDVRQWGLTNKPQPEAYDIFDGRSQVRLVLHTSLAPTALTAAVRHELGALDPALPLFSVRTMDEVIADSASGQRFVSLLVVSFAVLAALLAAIGIYGVLSYAVTGRTREIGIRMSLGASRGRMLAGVLADGMRLAAIGLAVGIAGALAAGRVLRSLLSEVKPGDPAVIVATAVLLALVALLACWLPARRASRLDPMSALRYE